MECDETVTERWGVERRGGGGCRGEEEGRWGEADQPAEIERNNSENMRRMKWRERLPGMCLGHMGDDGGGGWGWGWGLRGCGNYIQDTKI